MKATLSVHVRVFVSQCVTEYLPTVAQFSILRHGGGGGGGGGQYSILCPRTVAENRKFLASYLRLTAMHAVRKITFPCINKDTESRFEMMN